VIEQARFFDVDEARLHEPLAQLRRRIHIAFVGVDRHVECEQRTCKRVAAQIDDHDAAARSDGSRRNVDESRARHRPVHVQDVREQRTRIALADEQLARVAGDESCALAEARERFACERDDTFMIDERRGCLRSGFE
jgi:hypothetical protein